VIPEFGCHLLPAGITAFLAGEKIKFIFRRNIARVVIPEFGCHLLPAGITAFLAGEKIKFIFRRNIARVKIQWATAKTGIV